MDCENIRIVLSNKPMVISVKSPIEGDCRPVFKSLNQIDKPMGISIRKTLSHESPKTYI